MKIKMLTRAAGPDGVWEPGRVLHVDNDIGEALVAGGYAEALEQPEPEQAEAKPKRRTSRGKRGAKDE